MITCLLAYQYCCHTAQCNFVQVIDLLACAIQGCKYMYEREGMRGMFQGNGTNCVRIIPNQAVKFMAYEQITR